MTNDRVFSDDDLSCYLDGETSGPLTDAIRAAVLSDPKLEARLEELTAGQQRFAQIMEAALTSAPDMPTLPPAIQYRAPPVWPVALASAAAGAFAVLGVSWFSLSTPEQPGWHDVVANYQSLYVTQTLELVNQSPQDNLAELDRLSETIGFDLTNLPQIEGLSYKRSQELGFKGRPLAQLTFLTADGGPVALCIIRTGKTDTPEIKAEMLSGMSAYSWTDDGYGLLLIGPPGDPALENAAEIFRKSLKTSAI